MSQRAFTSIELFTGAGGLALGVSAAGFQHRLLLEYNKDACQTLRANHSAFDGASCLIHEGDVKKFDFDPFVGVDLLAAGAPCQPFSIGGKHRAFEDGRNLFPQVFRAIREVRPRAVLVENVKGLLRANLADFVEFIELQLSFPLVLPPDALDPNGWQDHLRALRRAKADRAETSLEYDVKKVLLNAADFGVPQRRERVFFVAIRRDLATTWVPPVPSHSSMALRIAQEVTGAYWKSHEINRRDRPLHPLAGKWRREGGRTKAWLTVRDALDGLPAPVPRKGDDRFKNHVGQPGAKMYPGHTGSPLDSPAKTLKAGVHGVPGGENMLRNPNGTVRYFTVREAARLQTFPDHYEFKGAWGEAMRQIGNAVPVRLAQAVAGSIRVALEEAAIASAGPRPLRRKAAEYVQADLPGLLAGASPR